MAQPSKPQLLIAALIAFLLLLAMCLLLLEPLMSESPISKVCPICSQQLAVSEFGICRARKDGRNLYCKSCIRKKVTASRRALKEYRAARKRYVSVPANQSPDAPLEASADRSRFLLLEKLSPTDRVRAAIRKGARTQREIGQETRLGKDEIGDAIANLLLWTREIKTTLVDNNRHYFINESSELPIRVEATLDIPRQSDVRAASFSAIEGLMPGKKREVG